MKRHIFFLTIILPIFSISLFRKELYRRDKQLQQFTQTLTNEYENVRKEICANDDSYKYLTMGDVESSPYLAIIQCNIHARQIITSQICVEWAKRFLQTKYDRLQKISVKLFYRANNMRDQVFGQKPNLRKNKNGVDLNRQFPTQFNWYNQTKDSPIYSGQQPINQPYTICLQNTIQSRIPDIFIDLHSGGNRELFYQQGVNNKQQLDMLFDINKDYCNGRCRITTLKKDKQAINGHIFADLKVRLKVPISILYQTYGSDSQDTLKYFNPTSQKTFQRAVTQWSDITDFIIEKYIYQ